MLHAVLAVSSIARGRVARLDVAAAEAHPGVVEVMTPANAPKLASDPDQPRRAVHLQARPAAGRPRPLRQPADRRGDRRNAGGGDGRCCAAASDLRGRSRRGSASTGRSGSCRARSGAGDAAVLGHGDVDAGLAAAANRVEATYETPAQYHNAMEPHAIVAQWDGDRLELDTPSQGLSMAQARIAGLFGIAPGDIHIRSPFLGGGFGSKGVVCGAAGAGHHGGAPGGPPGEAGHAARTDVRPGGPPRADAPDAAPRHRRPGPPHRPRPSHADRVQHLRRLLRAVERRVAHALRHAGPRHEPRSGAARHRHAALHARAGRGVRQRRAGERRRRDGRRLRDGPARVPAGQLRRGGADNRQAVLVEGPARMLRARRRAVRLARAAAPAAADARRCTACWSAGAWAPPPSRR